MGPDTPDTWGGTVFVMVTRSPRPFDYDPLPPRHDEAGRSAWLTRRMDAMLGFKRDDEGNLLDDEESPQ